MTQQNGIAQSTAERGIPGTSTRKKSRIRLFLSLLLIVVLLLVGAGLVTVTINRFTAMKVQEKEEARKAQAEKAKGQTAETNDLSKEIARIKIEGETAEAAAQANLSVPAGAGQIQPNGAYAPLNASAPTAAATNHGSVQPPQLPRRYSGDVTILSSDKESTLGQGNAGIGLPDAIESMKKMQESTKQPASFAPTKTNVFEEQLAPSSIPPAKATLLPNLDFLLKRNTIIPCGVPVRVVSTYPGAVKCTVLQDVYSSNLKLTLVRRGAEVFGEQRVALIQGQARIYVLWNEIVDGPVSVPINSPAADSLGSTGLEAHVDNHFWQRFGGAIMVSLIGDFGQAFANRSIGNGSGQVTLSNSSNATQSAAEEVLRNTINIPPTAYSQQGAMTNIFIARHIDFSSVYKVIKHD